MALKPHYRLHVRHSHLGAGLEWYAQWVGACAWRRAFRSTGWYPTAKQAIAAIPPWDEDRKHLINAHFGYRDEIQLKA